MCFKALYIDGCDSLYSGWTALNIQIVVEGLEETGLPGFNMLTLCDVVIGLTCARSVAIFVRYKSTKLRSGDPAKSGQY